MASKWLRDKRYRLWRGITRAVSAPLVHLSDSGFKRGVQKWLLHRQHSLPVEIVVSKSETIVQIGTPWPKTLKRLRSAVGEGGKVIIFEANPANFANLTKCVEAENFENVMLVQAAACNVEQKGKLSRFPARS